jgi:hypothetical protein
MKPLHLILLLASTAMITAGLVLRPDPSSPRPEAAPARVELVTPVPLQVEVSRKVRPELGPLVNVLNEMVTEPIATADTLFPDNAEFEFRRWMDWEARLRQCEVSEELQGYVTALADECRVYIAKYRAIWLHHNTARDGLVYQPYQLEHINQARDAAAQKAADLLGRTR